MRLIAVKIDCTKIDKSKLFLGKNGAKYLDCLLQEVENDTYGNDFRVVQAVSKEERLAGTRGAILGNGKYLGQAGAPKQEAKVAGGLSVAKTIEDDGSSVPF
tara:strand:+ start:55 stop:360 length:306 start_codon:yes stop_codon:yes gene_type:complete